MRLDEIVSFLDDFLAIGEWEDKSINGLQVEGRKEVDKIAFAVDACMETFVKAKEIGADMLVVHHGLIWGGVERIKGMVRKRLKFLLENDISLYACHLPLDAHPKVGNNVELLRIFGVEAEGCFGVYRGKPIGYYGRLDEPKSLEELVNALGVINDSPIVLDFGEDEVETIGAVSGKGAFAVSEAIELGLDLFVTGEGEHEAYHVAKEGRINVIFAGHYATETLGVKALMRVVGEEFAGEVEVKFVDVPTGL